MKKALTLVVTLAMLLSIIAALPAAAEQGEATEIVMWGIDPLAIGSGHQEMIDHFNKTHPDINLVAQSTPGTSGYDTQDLSKLTAAIAAGNPPDVMYLNAPFILEVAARGVLEPLTGLIEKAGLDMDATYYAYTVAEMSFNGDVWALPYDVDGRYLFYNKQAFRDAGLDPEKPPKTWDELYDYAMKMTTFDDAGNLVKVGFIPNFGNIWLYMYAIANGGQFIDDTGKIATMNDPKIVEALEFMVEGYDMLGGAEKVNSFTSGFGSAVDDPFLNGTVAMLVNVDNAMASYIRYNPGLDFGVAMPPTPTGNDEDQITWSGGWCFGIPKGSQKAEAAFEAIRYLTTEGPIHKLEGQHVYNQENGLATFPSLYACFNTNTELYNTYVADFADEKARDAYKFMSDNLKYSISLPATPVGQQLFSLHCSALDAAIYHTATAQEALDDANRTIQRELDRFWASYQ